MRGMGFLTCMLALGCGGEPNQDPPRTATLSPTRATPATAVAQPATGPVDTTPDLRTRKTGSDWCRFLGPLGTSVSTEKGILSPWPKEGLRVVWQKPVGTGYGVPAISRGRLFQFDRHGD